MRLAILLISTTLAGAALADEKRELSAHQHGVGALNIAIDGQQVVMEMRVPGADIVGFEHAAESEEDRAAIETAVATLAKPLSLFQIPAAANCSVTEVRANLVSDEDHHDHDEDHADAHDHDDHAEHDHEAHAEHDHDDHGHKEEHAHDDDHAHEEDHAEHDHGGESHSEFEADYRLTCNDPEEITEITFAYFDSFENAQALNVQLVSASGAQSAKVERASPVLDMRNLF